MQSPKLRFTISLFALVLLAVNVAQADKIDFSWQTSFTPISIAPDQPTQGARIYFSSASGNEASISNQPNTFDPGHIQYALGIANQFPPFLTEDATYTNKPFVMTLKLTDGPSGLSDSLTFHGMVNGTIIIAPPPLAEEGALFSFSDGVRSMTVGQDVYHITMRSGAIGGGTDPLPNIFAEIDVTHASNTPEPSSLLLAAMALPVLGFAFRRKNAIILLQRRFS